MTALIVSAIVTPDATLYTMLLMAVPLMVMYELGIVGAKLFGRPTKPVEAAASFDDEQGSSGPGEDSVPGGTAGYRVQ